MDNIEKFKIDLLSSQLQGKTFELTVDDEVFQSIDGLVQRGNVSSKVECLSAGSVFKFLIHSEGSVIVPCDRCLADLELRIETTDELAVKLGSEYSDEGDYVIIPENEGYIDLAQYIYEFIVLSMPITCTHEPGKCDDTMMQELSKHQAVRSSFEDDKNDDSNESIDPRWSALMKLKDNN